MMEFTRYYPWFAPEGWTFYKARWQGMWVGDVAHDGKGHWHADNKRWAHSGDNTSEATVGGELAQKFRRRFEAADALWHIANETASAENYGGYAA